jgi:hypothetical protein
MFSIRYGLFLMLIMSSYSNANYHTTPNSGIVSKPTAKAIEQRIAAACGEDGTVLSIQENSSQAMPHCRMVRCLTGGGELRNVPIFCPL